MVSVNNIVSVNLQILGQERSIEGYDTVVYVTRAELSKEGKSEKCVLVNNLNELEEYVDNSAKAVIASAKSYFANGGKKLLFINPSEYTSAAFIEDIKLAKKIRSNFLFVCIQNNLISGDLSYGDEFEDIVYYCDNSKAPDKLRLLLTTNNKDFIEQNNLTNSLVAVKYCTKTVTSDLVDAALLIGAYFSKIDLDSEKSIKDYSYTREVLVGIDEKFSEEDISQDDFDKLVKNEGNTGFYNIIDKVGSHVVNFGGDYASNSGISIHTDFGAVAVERDVIYSVLELMIGKQYLTEQGMSNVKAAIDSKLQRYKTNGYLNMGARYSGEELNINYNGRNYTVVKNGEVLNQGFVVFTVPVANISADDRAKRRFTPIYIVLETQSGARVIEIGGEVRS